MKKGEQSDKGNNKRERGIKSLKAKEKMKKEEGGLKEIMKKE